MNYDNPTRSIVAVLTMIIVLAGACLPLVAEAGAWNTARSRTGWILTRGLVLDDQGNGIWAEYDKNGKWVSDLGSAQGKLKGARVISDSSDSEQQGGQDDNQAGDEPEDPSKDKGVKVVEENAETPDYLKKKLTIMAESAPAAKFNQWWNKNAHHETVKGDIDSLEAAGKAIEEHTKENGPVDQLRFEGHYGEPWLENPDTRRLQMRFVEGEEEGKGPPEDQRLTLRSLRENPKVLKQVKDGVKKDGEIVMSVCFCGQFAEDAEALADMTNRKVTVFNDEVLVSEFGSPGTWGFLKGTMQWTTHYPKNADGSRQKATVKKGSVRKGFVREWVVREILDSADKRGRAQAEREQKRRREAELDKQNPYRSSSLK